MEGGDVQGPIRMRWVGVGKSKQAINQWIQMGGVGHKIKHQLPGVRSSVNGLAVISKKVQEDQSEPRLHGD